jgi:hypothetical protein
MAVDAAPRRRWILGLRPVSAASPSSSLYFSQALDQAETLNAGRPARLYPSSRHALAACLSRSPSD